MATRIKVGDLVQVISGKDKGKRGEVLTLSKDKSKAKVRDIALATKFVKPQSLQKSGEIKKVERFIYSCKLMPVCSETDKPCRVKMKQLEGGKKVRISHKAGKEI